MKGKTPSDVQVGLVLLAAGASSRMGQPKQLLKIGGKSMIVWCVELALASVCDPIVVVLGANDHEIKQQIKDMPVTILKNEDWTSGMGSSLSLGLKKIQEQMELQAAVVVLGDQPLVSTDHINQLVQVFADKKPIAVASEYAGVLGVPALFDRSLFPQLEKLTGPIGAKNVLAAYKNELVTVSLPEASVDIDTPEDYAQLIKRLSGKK